MRFCGIRDLYGYSALSHKELYPTDDDGRPSRVIHEAVRRLDRLWPTDDRDRRNDLAFPLIEISEQESKWAEEVLAGHSVSHGKGVVAMSTGCKTKANQWPEDRFAELGRRILDAGGFPIVIVGGPAEKQSGDRLVNTRSAGLNLAGKLTIRESAAILSRCAFFIGLDTGTTHLAAAVGTRCFAIFGERNNPGRWFPIGSKHVVVRHRVPCAGCRQFRCPLKTHPCLRDISVDSVWPHLIAFLLKPNDHSKLDVSLIDL